MRRVVVLFIVWAVIGFTWLFPAGVMAHGIYIRGWVDDGALCTESAFDKNNKVIGAEVRMLGNAGEELALLVSDENGLACFALPKAAQNLNFVVQSAQGHRAEFAVSAADVAAALTAAATHTHDTDATSEDTPVFDSGPRARDVVGGVGWLVGIAGIVAWLRARRKKV